MNFGKMEEEYFCAEDWTGVIGLRRFRKIAVLARPTLNFLRGGQAFSASFSFHNLCPSSVLEMLTACARAKFLTFVQSGRSNSPHARWGWGEAKNRRFDRAQ